MFDLQSLAGRGTDTFSAGIGWFASLGKLAGAARAAEKVSVPWAVAGSAR
jgi:hypothetical protein